jgi:hypothetical protein
MPTLSDEMILLTNGIPVFFAASRTSHPPPKRSKQQIFFRTFAPENSPLGW